MKLSMMRGKWAVSTHFASHLFTHSDVHFVFNRSHQLLLRVRGIQSVFLCQHLMSIPFGFRLRHALLIMIRLNSTGILNFRSLVTSRYGVGISFFAWCSLSCMVWAA